MLREFIPVLFSIGVAVAIALGAIVVALILGKVGRRNRGKDLAYECGKDPIGGGSARFSVKFYLVAMIFILFDIEVIFMYPWAVSLMEFQRSGLGWQVGRPRRDGSRRRGRFRRGALAGRQRQDG